jgi:hypothetical protein
MSNWLDARDLDQELDDLRARFEDEEDCLDPEEDERRLALEALNEEVNLWEAGRNGSALIPDYDFEDYAEELAYDIGMVDRDAQISHYIDWDKWADDLKDDYLSVDFEGQEYWIQSY